MKTKKWAVERTRTIQGLIDFIKKFLKLVASEQLTKKLELYMRYTRNLVDQGNGKFNLMILCWGEGHGRENANNRLFQVFSVSGFNLLFQAAQATLCLLH
ncbi:Autophagy-related protein 12 [Cricetulus griseus]|uniref:Cysteine dioxygenase n=1 Tax=Cricetulus griseus TaxID=10029 RepID=G3HTN0_CRIGR|nr:Autophagy-related protein 12 [Cricetulus griseus]